MSRFSIVVPVHKVASYLRDCLDSVRGQDFGDWDASASMTGARMSLGPFLIVMRAWTVGSASFIIGMLGSPEPAIGHLMSRVAIIQFFWTVTI